MAPDKLKIWMNLLKASVVIDKYTGSVLSTDLASPCLERSFGIVS